MVLQDDEGLKESLQQICYSDYDPQHSGHLIGCLRQLLIGALMDRAKAQDIVRWFARCGDRYVQANLGHINVQLLETDRHYGLKLFFFTWAFERSGAPRAYRIAAVKAVSSLNDSQSGLRALFGKFCHGKIWKGGVPAIEPESVDFDVRKIAELVKHGTLGKAFHALELKGMSHKLKAFFLRDVVTLLESEEKLGGDHEAYMYCQPIDVWVRFAVEELCGTNDHIPGALAKYQLGGADAAKARDIIQLSLDAKVSPLRVNQGIWYFSANAVADEKRLKELIGSGDCKKLEKELKLMEGFLPTRPTWG